MENNEFKTQTERSLQRQIVSAGRDFDEVNNPHARNYIKEQ